MHLRAQGRSGTAKPAAGGQARSFTPALWPRAMVTIARWAGPSPIAPHQHHKPDLRPANRIATPATDPGGTHLPSATPAT